MAVIKPNLRALHLSGIAFVLLSNLLSQLPKELDGLADCRRANRVPEPFQTPAYVHRYITVHVSLSFPDERLAFAPLAKIKILVGLKFARIVGIVYLYDIDLLERLLDSRHLVSGSGGELAGPEVGQLGVGFSGFQGVFRVGSCLSGEHAMKTGVVGTVSGPHHVAS